MKRILINVVIIAAMAMIFSTSSFAQVKPKLGGYKPAETDNERVVEAADFAVNKRVETHAEQEGLTLDSIDKAETQIVAGTNFRLCLTVSIGDESQQVQAVVYQNLQKAYSLSSWTVVECAEKADGEALKNESFIMRDIDFKKVRGSDVAICSGSQLSLKVGEGDAAMGGKIMERYVFTNISSTSCSISGYPAFVLLDKSGKVLRGVKITHRESSSPEAPPTVTLKPKETAWFEIYYSTGMGYDLKRKPASSSKVKITLRNTRTFILKEQIAAYKEISVDFIRSGSPD